MLDAIAILLVVLIAWIWSARGFFSGFVHMLCVIVAGALAFALWEPIALWVMSRDNSTSGWIIDLAWGASLAIPFALFISILRGVVDKLLPANLDFDGVANLIGGGLCGAVSGVIAVGIMLLSIGYLRLERDSYFAHTPVTYQANGSLVRDGDLWVPVDRWTASVFAGLSEGAFLPYGGETLARWHPRLADEGPLLRTSFDDGKSKASTSPNAFEIMGMYVYDPKGKDRAKELMTDSQNPSAQQYSYTRSDDDPPNLAQSEILGYVVKFKAPAKEAGGKVIVGAGQARLIVQTNPNDPASTMPIQPLAVISQAAGDKPTLGRWRFDTMNVFIASVGGASDATMAFEFLVPKGATPIGLYVKGVRENVEGMKPFATYDSLDARAKAIESQSILPTASVSNLDYSTAANVRINPQDAREKPIFVTSSLPFQLTLQKDNVKSLVLGDENRIIGGEVSKFSRQELKNIVVERTLAVRGFGMTDDTVIVQVVMDGTNTEFGPLTQAAAGYDPGKPAILIDNNGAAYQAIGYVLQVGNGDETWIYFNPQAPLASMTDRELPVMSISKPDQKMRLIFRVSKGVKVTAMALGDKVVAKFTPPIETAQGR